MKYPTSWWGARWREALPSGNGAIGAAVYGAVHEETVLLTHEDLWHRSRTENLPDVSHLLPKVRSLLYAQRVHEAERVIEDELKKLNYRPKIGSPLPLADLKLKMPVHAGFAEYRRSLDMETGEVSVTWRDGDTRFERKLFVSRTDDIVVMEVTSSDDTLMLELGLDLHDRADVRSAVGKVAKLPRDLEVLSDPSGYIRYAAHNDDNTDFGIVARVLPFISEKGEKPVLVPSHGGLHVEHAERVLIVLKPFVKGRRQSAWPELMKELRNIDMNYEALLAPHVAEHKAIFDRVQFHLGGAGEKHDLSNEELLLDAYQGEASKAMVEKMWAYGRYLLVSSSRQGGQPCALHGKWCGSYLGFWTFHMANENLQMIYWQALSGQMAETVTPVFDYYDRLIEDFKENARNLYGCRGIYVPAVTTPESGLLKTTKPHIIHWTGAAAWLCQHYYDYYLYTGDKDFLRDRAFPFLRETALFYEDFFTLDEDGFYQSAPSNSPENTPGNYWDGDGMGASMETTINATMDFALAREVLTHLLEASEALEHEDKDEIAKWSDMRERIPPYQINVDGAVREWMHPYFTDNYHHRHQSHIYPVFPGLEVTRDSDPELFRAFEIAIQKRLRIGISEQTGWSLAHMANVYARMSDGNQALNCLNLMARSCIKNNFYSSHNDWRNMGVGVNMPWAPFQIDANMGWTAAIHEMLLLSVPGDIRLLPAVPDDWARGTITGLMARGGIMISIEWDLEKKNLKAELTSMGRDQKLTVRVPFGDKEVQLLELKADQVHVLTVEGHSAE